MPKIHPKKSPSFHVKSELARYVHQEYCRNGHISSAAFHKKPDETYLSVNSLELETINSIAEYYRKLFQDGDACVAVSCKKIIEYNSAAKDAGIFITYDKSLQAWRFQTTNGLSPAYKHRAVKNSYSHCGVEFISSPLYDELAEKKFARRMSGNKPHLIRS